MVSIQSFLYVAGKMILMRLAPGNKQESADFPASVSHTCSVNWGDKAVQSWIHSRQRVVGVQLLYNQPSDYFPERDFNQYLITTKLHEVQVSLEIKVWNYTSLNVSEMRFRASVHFLQFSQPHLLVYSKYHAWTRILCLEPQFPKALAHWQYGWHSLARTSWGCPLPLFLRAPSPIPLLFFVFILFIPVTHLFIPSITYIYIYVFAYI